MISNIKLYLRIGLVAVIIGMAITIGVYSLKTKALKADNARLEQEAALAREEARQATEARQRDRVFYQAAGLALTTAATTQGQIYQEDLGRRAQIEEIGRECQVIIIPEGAVDEGTSTKAINMFNNSLFSPLGGMRE